VSCPAPTESPSYRGYRYPAEVISYTVWLYYRFSLSLRDVEELLAERGVTSRTRRSAPGAPSSAQAMLRDCAGGAHARATHGIWMRCC
jgi:hypothetical protein